jgi:hypothetical protein
MTKMELTNNRPAPLSKMNHYDRTVTIRRSKSNLAMIPYRGSTPRRKMSEAARCSNSVGKVDVY